MSGKSTLKFLIPESSCEQDFSVFALFADGAKEKVLRCDWFGKYDCDSAPGYTHTIENDTAVITVSRDLKKEPEVFICEPYFQLTPDTKRCFCKMHVPAIIPGQPDSLNPWKVGLIAFAVVAVVVVMVVVGFLIYKYRRRTSLMYTQNPNRRRKESQPLNEANKDAPKISLIDSQKSSTATLICVSCGAVQLIKMLIEANKDAPKISLTDSQKSSTATVICFSCEAVQLIKMLTSQTSEPSMDVPQISAADLQESSTPAVTAPPTETVPPKKETNLGRNKTHP